MHIANRKLIILNIIPEISRIQFLPQQMWPKENVVKVYKMGIKLDIIPIILDYKKIGKIIILLIYTKKIKYKLNWPNIEKLSYVLTNAIELILIHQNNNNSSLIYDDTW